MFARPTGKSHILLLSPKIIDPERIFIGIFIFLMGSSRSIFYLSAFFLELTFSTIMIFVFHSTASLITHDPTDHSYFFVDVDITNKVQ